MVSALETVVLQVQGIKANLINIITIFTDHPELFRRRVAEILLSYQQQDCLTRSGSGKDKKRGDKNESRGIYSS